MMLPLLLAQTVGPPAPPPPAEAAPPPWWHALLDQGLLILVVFIFLTAIVTLIVQQRRRDKCLKLFHDYHITFLAAAGKAIWGDLIVFPKALEVVFDQPYKTRRGIFKSSALLYEPEVGGCLAICRTIDGLTRPERDKRRKQIRRSFNPNFIRRTMRWLRNLLNTLRDAFSKALSALIGAVATKATPGGMMATQKGSVDQIGQTLLGAAGNAYEPILERHIGRPVVLQLKCPAAGENVFVDLPGYLVDYTEKYVAIFNVEHDPVEEQRLTIESEPVTLPWVSLAVSDQFITLTCTGPELLVIKTVKTQQRYYELEVTLAKGGKVDLRRDGGKVELLLQRTRRVDVVCPRSQANIYFGGDTQVPDQMRDERPRGVAPEADVEEASDEPADAKTDTGGVSTEGDPGPDPIKTA